MAGAVTLIIPAGAPDAAARAAKIVKSGGIIVYPTETAYGMGCSALDRGACERIFELKGRDAGKPLPVIVADRKMAEKYLYLDAKAAVLIEKFMPGPLTIIARKKKDEKIFAGDGETLAFRVSSSGFCREVSKLANAPIVSTSANISGGGEIYGFAKAMEAFYGKADAIVDGGDLAPVPPSTIVKMTGNEAEVVREGPISGEEIFESLDAAKEIAGKNANGATTAGKKDGDGSAKNGKKATKSNAKEGAVEKIETAEAEMPPKNGIKAKGAEAFVTECTFMGKPAVAKRRLPKRYRIAQIDEALRRRRTLLDARLLHLAKTAGVRCPLVHCVNPVRAEIIMQKLDGKLLSRSGPGETEKHARTAGEYLAKIHRAGIYHGDYTTTNLMACADCLWVIDFGLSANSHKAEDHATDLLLFKKSVPGDVFEDFLRGYKAENPEKYAQVVASLEGIEARGRYVARGQ